VHRLVAGAHVDQGVAHRQPEFDEGPAQAAPSIARG